MTQLNDLLYRNVEDIIVRKDFEELIKSGKKIKLYFGVDPTSTSIHLGHAVPLRKLRDFLNLGHKVYFLVGSFTALIGDTSDKNAPRKALTQKEIDENFKTYKNQASKILDFDKAEIVYNGDWLNKLQPSEIVKLAQQFTVQQMIQRDLYQRRLEKNSPIGMHEFMYPLFQGYDSVELNVDLEIGGNDQMFNMLAGRTLQKLFNKKDKHIMTTVLIPGLDGRKMSKSYNNVININDKPSDMYGKVMSMKDEMIIPYFIHCTDLPINKIDEIDKEIKRGFNPRDFKMKLANEIVALYHGKTSADKAEKHFKKVFQNKEIPDKIKEYKVKSEKLINILAETSLAPSKSQARRLIEQGAVKIDSKKITDVDVKIKPKGQIISVGKRKFGKLNTL